MNTTKDIWLAAGCFWGAQKFFKGIEGVEFTEVGFVNGNTENPTYEQVYTDTTGYAECVHVRYNPQKISLKRIAELFFKIIDPLSINKQGEDKGTRYRTGIYYAKDCIAENEIEALEKVFDSIRKELNVKSLAVELLPVERFYTADEFHQDYLDKNPGGYCHLNPEVFKIKS